MRRRIMASVGKALPYDAEVEWLQCATDAYLETGIPWDTELDIDISSKMLEDLGFVPFFGARDVDAAGAGVYIGGAGTASSGTYRVHIDKNGKRTNTSILGTSGRLIRVVVQRGRWDIYANGVRLNSGEISYTPGSGLHTIVFGGFTNGEGLKSGNSRFGISKCKVGDLIDCYAVRKDGVGYMFDRVTNMLIGASGGGAFTLGPDVVSTEGGG